MSTRKQRIVCWLLGHQPILREDMKVVLKPRTEDHGHVILEFIGRTLYMGETECRRCGKKMTLK